jgi:pilus assembly protein FimV
MRNAPADAAHRKPAPADPVPGAAAAHVPDFSLEKFEAQSTGGARSRAPDTDIGDFNLDPQPPVGRTTDAAGPARDIGDAAPPTPAAAAEPAPEFKLDLKDFDLDFAERSTPQAPPKDEHWHDVQQKFDLARAYEEMGDKAGARGILEEVVREGDTEQQAHAKKLLSALA